MKEPLVNLKIKESSQDYLIKVIKFLIEQIERRFKYLNLDKKEVIICEWPYKKMKE